jgi:hypothetical protein
MELGKPKQDQVNQGNNQNIHSNPKQQPKKSLLEPKIPQTVTKQIDEIMRRLRLLEERYSGLRKKTQFTEQNMLKDAKDLFEENKALHEAISDITNKVSELNENLVKLLDEVKTTITKAEFNVLSKYVDYWQPMNFLTRKVAEELIDDAIKDNNSKKSVEFKEKVNTSNVTKNDDSNNEINLIDDLISKSNQLDNHLE